MDFLGLSSYGDLTESSGVVQITQDLSRPVVGRDVLVVEDIVDTGLTLSFLLSNFHSRHQGFSAHRRGRSSTSASRLVMMLKTLPMWQ